LAFASLTNSRFESPARFHERTAELCAVLDHDAAISVWHSPHAADPT
jgi:hypothetical protein